MRGQAVLNFTGGARLLATSGCTVNPLLVQEFLSFMSSQQFYEFLLKFCRFFFFFQLSHWSSLICSSFTYFDLLVLCLICVSSDHLFSPWFFLLFQ